MLLEVFPPANPPAYKRTYQRLQGRNLLSQTEGGRRGRPPVLLFGGDILIDDALDRSVGNQLLQRLVDRLGEGGVGLAGGDGVVLGDILGLQNLQSGVGLDEGLGRFVVDDDAVNLIGDEGHDGVRALGIALHILLAQVLAAIDIAGGGELNAYVVGPDIVEQVVGGGDGGVLGDNDDLNAGGVRAGEVHDRLPVRHDGQTRHADVGLAGLNGGDDGVKFHILDFELQAKLFRDGGGHLRVDANNGAAVVVLIGRELGVGRHGQIAFVGIGRLLAAGGQGQQSQARQQ